MTNVIIRKLIDRGYSPESAYDLCHAYMTNLSLSDLEALISIMEEDKQCGSNIIQILQEGVSETAL